MKVDMNVLREALLERRENGGTYIKAGQLAEMTGYTVHELSHGIREAKERGWITKWTSKDTPSTYRIEIGDG